MSGFSLIAVALVCLGTVAVGTLGLRFSRTTSDFYVASRSVRPWWNASAIGGEYLSAASYLGVVGLIVVSGSDALWYPVGYASGYLLLLLFVAAPLRRSGAYTIPDFIELRLGSAVLRRACSLCVIVVCWLYLVPQLQGAAITVVVATGLPGWIGPVAVIAVVCTVVMTGGMRSTTFVQAFQFWLKFSALLIPLLALLLVLFAQPGWPERVSEALNQGTTAAGGSPELRNLSLMIGLLFGTLGLPHVLVRFYTNPDGNSARKTTLIVLPLLCLFYLLPIALGILAKIWPPNASNPDTTVLLLPSLVIPGVLGQLLAAIVAAGAFAAFLSSSSGLVVSLAGVLSQDFFGGRVRGFRWAALLGVIVPLLMATAQESTALAGSVGAVFAFTASTLGPVLLLGIWWRKLTDVGAFCGLATGTLVCGGALLINALFAKSSALEPGLLSDLLVQPAIVAVPAAFAAVVLGSLLSQHRVPQHTERVLAQLHTPEGVLKN